MLEKLRFICCRVITDLGVVDRDTIMLKCFQTNLVLHFILGRIKVFIQYQIQKLILHDSINDGADFIFQIENISI